MAIKRLKVRKSGGPDGTTIEMFQAMDQENRETIRDTLNQWWTTEAIDKEALRARVVHLYKKGNTSDLANYRPISLLNTMYKLFAAITQTRLANGIDRCIHKTQYGFRKARSTQQAIHLIRRLLEVGESTTSAQSTNKLILVLLDWEKAFDKLTLEGLFTALERANIPAKIIAIIKAIYANPEFQVEIEGVASSWHKQETGIRQGCPLSPYLFIIFMTIMFDDVKQRMKGTATPHRTTGARFDEVLFADDTICFSKDTRVINKMLQAIEEIGWQSGMRLNKGKCEVILFGNNANVHFPGGAKMKANDRAKYLGCVLNKKRTPQQKSGEESEKPWGH